VSLRLRDRIEGDLVVEVAFTDSALDVGDRAPAEVRRAALHAVAEEAGALPVIMHQVHGSDVAVVDDVRAGPPTADAMVTSRQHVALLARAADCVPVLLGDAGAGLVGAVHSGRGGLAHGVVPAAVSRLRELGAGQITAWIGPHVCGACYEVPAELRDEVAAQVPSAYSTTSWGTPSLDLGAGVRAQLEDAGVADVRTVGGCTREDESWPSYRRDGDGATRFAGLVWMHES
jgi:YfiH family protein